MTENCWVRKAACAAGLLVAVLSGCGDGTKPLPELAPVTGTITMDGKPLADAEVLFIPASSVGFTAAATTDSSGAYTLQTASGKDSGPGAPAGEYKVTVSRYVDGSGNVVKPTADQGPMG